MQTYSLTAQRYKKSDGNTPPLMYLSGEEALQSED